MWINQEVESKERESEAFDVVVNASNKESKKSEHVRKNSGCLESDNLKPNSEPRIVSQIMGQYQMTRRS